MTSPSVQHLFPARGALRSTRVGVEHEQVVRDSRTGEAVPIRRTADAVAGSSYSPYVTFEPGGQVELSLPCCGGPDDLELLFRHTNAALREDCARAGILVDSSPVDTRPLSSMPLQLLRPRYLAMQRHFDTIGPAGRAMMRLTASTQVGLDWWSGSEGLEQWRLALLSGPFLASAFSRSSGAGSRLAIWLAVDPARTAFDGRLVHGDDPVSAYAEFARGATVFAPEEHLSTLFPPVRPRGRYLEIRWPDVQPDDQVPRLVVTLATLLYDAELRRAALRMLGDAAGSLDRCWWSAAHEPHTLADRGHALLSLAGTGELVGAA